MARRRRMKRSYAILGVGGVGGYYGAALARAGHPVHWLVRHDADHLRRDGLCVETRGETWRVPTPSVAASPDELPPVDVAIVAIKTTENHRLPEWLPRALQRPDTAVLMMQNGLGPEDDAARAAPGRPIFGGLCFLCSHKVAPGHIRHLDYGKVTFAAWSPDGSPAGTPSLLAAIAADFAAAGIETEVLPDLLAARWRKLVWNAPFSGLCVALRTDTRALVTNPATRRLAADLMAEIQTGAAAWGREIPDAFLDHMFELTDRMTPYMPSMQLDFEAGRPMEIEAIYERPVAAARQRGVAMSRVEMLGRLLRFLEAQPRVGGSAGKKSPT